MTLTADVIRQFQNSLNEWYEKNKRPLPWRANKDPYNIWISEVMLQQTRVNTVIPYYYKFLEHFPSIYELANSDLDKVLKLWEGLGYYARARNLHKAVKIVVKEHKGKVPDKFDEFQKLPGVGDYIASAVQSIAFGLPFAVVDGNVKRVLARLLLIEEPVNQSNFHKIFKKKATHLLDEKKPSIYNQAMMELGSLICKPGLPNCKDCPVPQFCMALKKDKINTFPKRIKRNSTPTYHLTTGVICKNGKLLITKRKPEGLLGGLWEFPGGKLTDKEDAPLACVRAIKDNTEIDIKIGFQLTSVKHAYTHFKIKMDVFYCQYISGKVKLNGPVDFHWIEQEKINDFAFHKANLKFIHLLKKPML